MPAHQGLPVVPMPEYSMRPYRSEPAQQLASVAERFRSPLNVARWMSEAIVGTPVLSQQDEATFAPPAINSHHGRDEDLARLENRTRHVPWIVVPVLGADQLFTGTPDGLVAVTFSPGQFGAEDPIESGRLWRRVEQLCGGFQIPPGELDSYARPAE